MALDFQPDVNALTAQYDEEIAKPRIVAIGGERVNSPPPSIAELEAARIAEQERVNTIHNMRVQFDAIEAERAEERQRAADTERDHQERIRAGIAYHGDLSRAALAVHRVSTEAPPAVPFDPEFLVNKASDAQFEQWKADYYVNQQRRQQGQR